MYCLLFVSAKLRVISTLCVGVICGSLIRSSVDQADLEACSSLCSNCRGCPWKQSTLPHPWWRWRYSYTGGRRITLFGGQKSNCSRKKCAVSCNAKCKSLLASNSSGCSLSWTFAKSCEEFIDGMLRCKGSARAIDQVRDTHGRFQFLWQSFATGWLLSVGNIGWNPTDIARTKLVETVGFVIRCR